MTTKLSALGFVDDRNRRGPLPSIRRTAILRELTTDNAPVAMRFKTENGPVEDIRWSDGTFYRAFLNSGKPVTAGSPEMKQLELRAGVFATEEAAVNGIEDCLSKHVIISGALWIQSSEPLVFVNDDGMYTEIVASLARGDYREWDAWQTYSLNEVDDALAAAAARRKRHYGMTLDPAPTADGLMDILMPEVFTGPTRAERIRAARDAARTDAAEAVSELQADLSPENMEASGNRLLRAAKILKRETGD